MTDPQRADDLVADHLALVAELPAGDAWVSLDPTHLALDVTTLVGAGLHLRLVEGVYVESTGAHHHGEPTDVAHPRLAARLAEPAAVWSMATHDRRLQQAVLLACGPVDVEQLLGVRPEVLAGLRDGGVPTRVYVPFGPDWFRYWMRRLAESRGA